MFAQAATTSYELGSWANLTAVGALIVIVLYMVTKGFPAMLQTFTETSIKEREAFGIILTEQRNDFKEELKAERESHNETNKSCHAAIEKMSDNVQSLSDRLITACPHHEGEG